MLKKIFLVALIFTLASPTLAKPNALLLGTALGSALASALHGIAAWSAHRAEVALDEKDDFTGKIDAQASLRGSSVASALACGTQGFATLLAVCEAITFVPFLNGAALLASFASLMTNTVATIEEGAHDSVNAYLITEFSLNAPGFILSLLVQYGFYQHN